MFLNNKYTKIYFSLIEAARQQTIDGYCERHHIVPKCLGGLDTPENLVKLTARQHFIAHLLLTKMCEGKVKYKLYSAYSKMFCNGKDNQRYLPTSRFYEYSKKLLSESLTNDNPCHWVGVKEKMIENHWNKSDKANEIRQKISESKLGVKLNLSLEQRKNRSLTHLAERNNMFGKTHTDEVKAVLSNLKSKTYKLINIFTNQEIVFKNSKEYFKENRKRYVLFNNCRSQKRLFENEWKIEVVE